MRFTLHKVLYAYARSLLATDHAEAHAAGLSHAAHYAHVVSTYDAAIARGAMTDARFYNTTAEVIRDALRHLLRTRGDLRVQLAVHRYQSEEISLAKAASLAGISWTQMRDILIEQGVSLRLGPETVEEAREEV